MFRPIVYGKLMKLDLGPCTGKLDSRRRFHRFLFNWCLTRAEQALSQSEELAARWSSVAAHCALAFGCGELASQRLESLGLRLAKTVPTPQGLLSASTRRGSQWLHVMSIAYPVGGHTAFVRRWIENDRSSDEHHLVITCMNDLNLPELRESVEKRGGKVTALGNIPSIIARAHKLRALAWERADRVVLHIHPFDIIPTIAFGIGGGPPVLFLNHADHLFWVGASISDQIINLREAGEDQCVRLRDINRTTILPIPLPLPTPDSKRESSRISLRQQLGIPESALVFLTIGSAYKYQAIGNLDFLATVRKILAAVPGSFVVAVGPQSTSSGWSDPIRELQPRLIAVGEQRDLAPYHAAADIYLESFPFGSITALLEAALSGLPFVRIPMMAPPPSSSDRYTLSALTQPSDTDAYLARATALAASPEFRRREAFAARDAIISLHCGDAWRKKLEDLKTGAPRIHKIYPIKPKPLPIELDRFWTQFLIMQQNERHPDPVFFMADQALAEGLNVRLDLKLACVAIANGGSSKNLMPLAWWALRDHRAPIIDEAFRLGSRLKRLATFRDRFHS
jgi:hypothetical protein